MKIKLLLLCLIILLTTSCAKTEVIDTWKEDSQTEKFTSIFVFGLAKEPVYRAILERQLTNLLKDAGVVAHTTFDLFPNLDSIDKAEAAAVIKNKGGDGVIVARLVGKNGETLVLRGKTLYLGGVAVHDSDGWHSYYSTVSTQDIVVDNTIAKIETVIFNVDTKKRVWTSLTETKDTTAPDIIESYNKALVRQLKSSGLI
jgi:hypothetical protein